jgi:hypothetical protein
LCYTPIISPCHPLNTENLFENPFLFSCSEYNYWKKHARIEIYQYISNKIKTSYATYYLLRYLYHSPPPIDFITGKNILDDQNIMIVINTPIYMVHCILQLTYDKDFVSKNSAEIIDIPTRIITLCAQVSLIKQVIREKVFFQSKLNFSPTMNPHPSLISSSKPISLNKILKDIKKRYSVWFTLSWNFAKLLINQYSPKMLKIKYFPNFVRNYNREQERIERRKAFVYIPPPPAPKEKIKLPPEMKNECEFVFEIKKDLISKGKSYPLRLTFKPLSYPYTGSLYDHNSSLTLQNIISFNQRQFEIWFTKSKLFIHQVLKPITNIKCITFHPHFVTNYHYKLQREMARSQFTYKSEPKPKDEIKIPETIMNSSLLFNNIKKYNRNKTYQNNLLKYEQKVNPQKAR